jgi:putative hydrolase of the HAD superfamily
MQKKYTHLFFDLDNTIWDFDSNSFVALHEALRKTGLLEKIGAYGDYYKIFESVNDQLWALYREGKLSKRELRIQRFLESFEKNGTPFPEMGEKINDAYIAEMPGFTTLIDGARELLDYLHGKYEMAVITNGSKEVQYKKIDQSGLAKYFKKIFTSDEIGVPKPKKAIFEHAIKSMNARKRNSLMIGDSWEADIVGAMQCGIDQIYYSPRDDANGADPEKSTYITNISNHIELMNNQIKTSKTSTIIISSLAELFEIL